MAKEFLQKHFIDDVKGVLNKGGGSPRLQTKTINENGVYRPDPGYAGFSEIIVEVGGDQPSEPSIAAGLYTDNTYSTMTTSWQELLDAGVVHVNDGVLYTNFVVETWENASSDTLVGALVLPNDGSVTSLGDLRLDESTYMPVGRGALAACDGLVGVVVPNTVTSIPWNAFNGCCNLEVIVIPSGVTSIGDYAFLRCDSLTEVVIPSSVTSIGLQAFYSLASLTEVVISGGVTSIGECAFCDCTSLTNIKLPDSLISIGNSAFEGCSILADIVIPSSVTSIGSQAFSSCNAGKEVVIPSSVTSIGDRAFAFCDGLMSVTVLNEIPLTIDADVFTGCSNLTEIKVPASSVLDYQMADGWNYYSNIIVAI